LGINEFPKAKPFMIAATATRALAPNSYWTLNGISRTVHAPPRPRAVSRHLNSSMPVPLCQATSVPVAIGLGAIMLAWAILGIRSDQSNFKYN
jgi:hypothetical protein